MPNPTSEQLSAVALIKCGCTEHLYVMDGLDRSKVAVVAWKRVNAHIENDR
jgi:hypothetical protein